MRIMKYCRFEYKGKAYYGHAEGGSVIPYGKGYFDGGKRLSPVPIREVKLLAPVLPSKIVAVGVNYYGHADEMNLRKEIKPEPMIFLKPPSAVIGPDDKIIYPHVSKRLDFEAELAFVIKEDCKNVGEEDAGKYIMGYTCCNDVTCRDLQMTDNQWSRCKGFDTFCPLGPYIVADIDVSDLKLQSVLNGKVMQDSTTAKMINKPPRLLSYISSIMTLKAGDVVSCGTPEGIAPMKEGDIIEIKIEGIGTLTNVIARL